jgi:hypothetical protein
VVTQVAERSSRSAGPGSEDCGRRLELSLVEDRDAAAPEKLRRQSPAGNDAATEQAVVDVGTSAGGTAVDQDSQGDIRLLRADDGLPCGSSEELGDVEA